MAIRKNSLFISLLLVPVLLFLFNCEKWETVGTVSLDKLISFEELWKNRDVYKGKIITLQWGPEDLGGGTGSPPPIDGITYGYVNHLIDFDKTASMTIDYFEKNIIPDKLKNALNTTDSVPDKLFEVQIICEAFVFGERIESKYPLPSWVTYKDSILPFSLKTDLVIFERNNPKIKQITGILIESSLPKNPGGTRIPCFTIVPLGYRIQK